MVLAGVTCVGEFHYVHHGPGGVPYTDPNAMSAALVAAADEAGLRITLLDTVYLHGGIGSGPNDVQRRFSDGSIGAWRERMGAATHLTSSRARLGAAIHSVRAVDPASIEAVAEWASAGACVLHAHVSEQPAENQQCRDVYGLTPVALLARSGALGDRFTAVHATHLTGDDIAVLGGSGSTVCLCPTTERDLADGVGPTGSLRDAGARLTVGSDSHAVIDLLEEARAIELHERLATGIRGHHTATSLIRACTDDGHRSLGWPEAGRIEVGALADLVSVRLDTVRTAGATAATAIESTVFAANACDVHHVVVGGEVMVADGRHARFDVAAELCRTVSAW